MKELFSKKNIGYSFVFMLINITSITVITSLTGLNLRMAFIASGIATLLFHKLTKNKIPSFIGMSGSFVGGMIAVSQSQGVEYALGGVIGGGVCYILMALAFFKYQDKILKYLPPYILNIGIMLIGLSLTPIGANLFSVDIVISAISLITLLVIELKVKNPKVKMFSIPIAILISTLVSFVVRGIPTIEPQTLEFIAPKFSLEAFTMISVVTLATLFEVLSDLKFAGDLIEVDTFKEVGVGRILLGNGIGSILSGLLGANNTTSYSENNSGVQLTKYKSGYAQVGASLLFILVALIPHALDIFLYIPQASFAGVVLYLFASITINGMRGLLGDMHNKKKFMITCLALGLSFATYTIGGVTVSSIFVAVAVAIILNIVIKDTDEVI